MAASRPCTGVGASRVLVVSWDGLVARVGGSGYGTSM